MLNKLFLLMSILVIIFSTDIFAAIVILKSGQKLEGKIVEQTNKYIKMDPGIGMVLTYYDDEIDTIDGRKLQTAVSLPDKNSTQSLDQPQPENQSDIQPEIQTSLPNTSPEVQNSVNSEAETYYDLAVTQYNNNDYINAFKNVNAAQRSGYKGDLEDFKEKIQAAIDQQETEKNLRRAQEYNTQPHYYSRSSSNSNKDISYAIFGLFFGVFSFFHGLGALRKKRALENIPPSTVRGLALGLVELNGKAKKLKTLVAPLSGTECTYYRYTIERYESSGRSGRWVVISQGDSAVYPFYLDDSTGQIMVLPQGAEFIMPVDYTFSTRVGLGIPDNLINYMEKNSVQYKGMLGNYTLRFNEWHIKPDEGVFVMGTAQKNTSQIALLDRDQELMQEENRVNTLGDVVDVIIAKGDGGQIFILSDESQTRVVKGFSWQAFSGIWGGSALSLAMLAYLLFRFNLWSRF